MPTPIRILVALAVLSVTACESPNPTFEPGADLGASPADLAAARDFATAPQPDLAQQAAWGCKQIAQCGIACGTDVGCQTACYESGSPTGQALLQALAACIGQTCTQTGLGRCAVYPGDTSLDCTLCVDNSSVGGTTGYPCNPPNDSACGLCSAQSAACLAN
jgi:hypothetical protein